MARRAALALAGAAIALAVAGLLLRGSPSRPAAAAAGAGAAAALPPPVAPAFVPGPARPLGSTRHLTEYAPVQRPVAASGEPGAGAVVGVLPTRTPEGTRNIVDVLAHAQDARRRPWVRVRLAVLPNGTTGWVPRAALGGYGIVDTRLVVDLGALRATLYRAGRAMLRVPVGVGKPGWNTPRGHFYIRNRLTRYRSATYGPVAFGTSARSPTATGWPAGGFVGIHGTDQPDLIPGRISHGCIRMRNRDILALARLMAPGTPVTIR